MPPKSSATPPCLAVQLATKGMPDAYLSNAELQARREKRKEARRMREESTWAAPSTAVAATATAPVSRRIREAANTRFVAQLGPMLRFSGCSAARAAKCLRTVLRAWVR